MKSIKIMMLLIVTLTITNLSAQEKIKQYSFTVYYPGSSQSTCSDVSTAYISPIVSYNFEKYLDNDYIHPQDETNMAMELSSKWIKKLQAKFYKVDKNLHCFAVEKFSWKESYSAADELRDETIAYYKRLGYEVQENYSFSFSL